MKKKVASNEFQQFNIKLLENIIKKFTKLTMINKR